MAATIESIGAQFDQVRELMDSIKVDFESVIRDKSIPLTKRFNLFTEAPEEFRETNSYVWEPEALKSLGRRPWEYFTYCERYRYIDLVEIINDDYDLSNADDEEQFDIYVTRQVVEELVEEMLQNNIAGFTYDW